MRPLVLIALSAGLVAACSSTRTADGTPTTVSVPISDLSSPEAARPTNAPRQGDPIAVAISFVASTDDLMGHSPIGRREIFRKLVAPATVADQAAAFERAAADLASTFGVP